MSTKQMFISMFVMTIVTFVAVYLTAVFENVWIWGVWFMLMVAIVAWFMFIKPKLHKSS
ncbi:hypothetical protein [Kurthia huakuii]|uniref:hypothetical protein n=1 Tax=Kurthia huakuii TaxID=1421019 RepID=UPI0004AD726A|nr:hypothetical protein [Kurthia huakuii]MBM7698589.1 beta-lactamase regulating signal transducer with metallopeptidase domain [Kurthia huakuii]